MGGIKNDHYMIPLSAEIHVSGAGHITEGKLGALMGEPVQDRIIFYLGLFFDYKAGRYDLDADECCNFVELRRRLKLYF